MQITKAFKSFGPAIKGLKSGLLSENNLQVHIIIACIVIALGIFLHLNQNEWLWIVVAIGFVLASEYFNTALEKLTDLVSPAYNDIAGKVKDLAAAAVLVAVVTAVVIGLIIFLPHLITL